MYNIWYIDSTYQGKQLICVYLDTIYYAYLYVYLHPGRLTWNLKITVWFGRWFSFTIGWFLGSMLIFRGVFIYLLHFCLHVFYLPMTHADIMCCFSFIRYVERSQQKNVQNVKCPTQATVAEHYGLAPSARGYRFGNHPMTRGPVRFGGSGLTGLNRFFRFL